MKARKGGFTLVELLIVIRIIAILAGMLLIATGSATDSAEATKIINDLRNVKSAALLYYGDNLEWPDNAAVGSLDRYADRSFTDRYTVAIGSEFTETLGGVTVTRVRIGLAPKKTITSGIATKLTSKARDAGLYGTAEGASDSSLYTGGAMVYMNMR
jgi:general secretion pathway protein G